MTQTISETIPGSLGAGDTAVGAPLHCGGPMTLRETSWHGTSYGMIEQPTGGFDVELVWACACGFQLSHEEPKDLALPLSPALRRVAAAAADLLPLMTTRERRRAWPASREGWTLLTVPHAYADDARFSIGVQGRLTSLGELDAKG